MIDPAARPCALLTTREMTEADRLTIAAGTPEAILMDRAGAAVADHAERVWRAAGGRGAILVVAGPGNNGGDGLVAARRMQVRGLAVRVAMLGPVESIRGTAAEAAKGWHDPIEDARTVSFDGTGLIVDALLGAGLSRPIAGDAARAIDRINGAEIPVLAVDVPSGIDGTTGAAMGVAIRATETVTFFRRKPGHILLPGRAHAGVVHVAEIGIDPAVIATMARATDLNDPALWGDRFPWPGLAGHKYSRGHALVVSGGPTTSGAARLSARAALRIGAGLVTMGSPSEALAVNAAHLTAVMLKPCDDAAGLSAILADARKNVVVLGPGLGSGPATRALVEAALRRPAADGEGPPRCAVLDADALTSYAGDAAALAGLIAVAAGPVVVTPHDGEFKRVFGDEATKGSRLDRARLGAARLDAIVVLKGADTVVAAPDGRATIAASDAPYLATAGSGDVLSGLIGGLLAQKMPAFDAACAAVWCHADAARRFGPGLIAEDLPELMPAVLAALRERVK